MHSKNENNVVLGEFNGHIGSSIDGHKKVYDRHGWGIRNKYDERILEFANSLVEERFTTANHFKTGW